ncbi:MAG: HAD family hydrolase [Sphingobacteriales bacterium]|nr:MAG: HAD family hydrolase [Sphingobacteriales bacterium]
MGLYLIPGLTAGTQISRTELAGMVGWEGKKVMDTLIPGIATDRQLAIYDKVNERQAQLSQDECLLYDGVKEGLAKLSTQYKLFIVSNCAKGVISRFIDWAGIDDYITDEVAYGINQMPKNYNIKLLVDKYELKRPVYIGDTEGDGKQSRLAGLPFVLVTYGFGTTDDYDLKFDDFTLLTAHFVGL